MSNFKVPNKLTGRIAQEYAINQELTAEEFNKLPKKINEIIDSLGNVDTAISTSYNTTQSAIERLQEKVNQYQINNGLRLDKLDTDVNDLKDVKSAVARLEAAVSGTASDPDILKIDSTTGRLTYLGGGSAMIESDDVRYSGTTYTITSEMNKFTKFETRGETNFTI